MLIKLCVLCPIHLISNTPKWSQICVNLHPPRFLDGAGHHLFMVPGVHWGAMEKSVSSLSMKLLVSITELGWPRTCWAVHRAKDHRKHVTFRWNLNPQSSISLASLCWKMSFSAMIRATRHTTRINSLPAQLFFAARGVRCSRDRDSSGEISWGFFHSLNTLGSWAAPQAPPSFRRDPVGAFVACHPVEGE